MWIDTCCNFIILLDLNFLFKLSYISQNQKTSAFFFFPTYVVKVFAQGNLAADQLVCQVVVLLLQAHVGLLQTTVLPLQVNVETKD